MSTILTTIVALARDPACLGGRRELKESSSPTDAFVLLSPTSKAVVAPLSQSRAAAAVGVGVVYFQRERILSSSLQRMRAAMCCEATQNGREEDATLSLISCDRCPSQKFLSVREEGEGGRPYEEAMRRRAEKRDSFILFSISDLKLREQETMILMSDFWVCEVDNRQTREEYILSIKWGERRFLLLQLTFLWGIRPKTLLLSQLEMITLSQHLSFFLLRIFCSSYFSYSLSPFSLPTLNCPSPPPQPFTCLFCTLLSLSYGGSHPL